LTLTGDRPDAVVIAEDVVAETFLAAFRARDRYDTSWPDARPWLFAIVTKELARHHRSEKARYRALTRSPVDRPTDELAERVAGYVSAQATRWPPPWPASQRGTGTCCC
jgi:RNA polymerase sigma-70 factor (ECF subfamily)